jgi:2-polyprenyl-3-methyl-5-hydroxy-6-metoxy-1,4-benzoquinol methylase
MNPSENKYIASKEVLLCPACSGASTELFGPIRDRFWGVPGEWSHRKCAACGLIWVNPLPLDSDVHKLYVNYYTHDDKPYDIPDAPPKKGLMAGLRSLYRNWVAHSRLAIERERLYFLDLKDHKPGRLLELGSGNGDRLVSFAKMGWQVEGHDLDPKAAALAKSRSGAVVHVMQIADLPGESEYDLVLMNHVLEHVVSPVDVLKKIQRLLKPGGILAVALPNSDSYNFVKFGVNWLSFDPPRHTYYYNAKNLENLAKQAGLSKVHQNISIALASGNIRGSLSVQETGKQFNFRGQTTFFRELQVFSRYFWLLVRGTGRLGQGDDLVLHFKK